MDVVSAGKKKTPVGWTTQCQQQSLKVTLCLVERKHTSAGEISPGETFQDMLSKQHLASPKRAAQ